MDGRGITRFIPPHCVNPRNASRGGGREAEWPPRCLCRLYSVLLAILSVISRYPNDHQIWLCMQLNFASVYPRSYVASHCGHELTVTAYQSFDGNSKLKKKPDVVCWNWQVDSLWNHNFVVTLYWLKVMSLRLILQYAALTRIFCNSNLLHCSFMVWVQVYGGDGVGVPMVFY